MLRRMRHTVVARSLLFSAAAATLWQCGPVQAANAATSTLRQELTRRAGKARALSLDAQRAIRGRATYPGAPRSWQHSMPALGGFGTVNTVTGNLHVTIPVVSLPGKGIPIGVTLYHNSAATVSGFNTARPPIADGWTFSYNVYLNGAGTSSVTVVEGDGTQNTFSQNMSGSFTAPAGDFDTLVRNVSGTYTLTRKNGVTLNFGSNNKLSTIVDLNGNTTTVAYGTNGYPSSVTDAASRAVTFTYNGSNQLTTITDNTSRQFTLAYDSGQNLRTVTYPAPATGVAQPYFQFTTNATGTTAGTITAFQDRRGNSWSISYSSADVQRPSSITDPYGNSRGLSVSGTMTFTLEDGTTYTISVDGSGNVSSIVLGSDPYHAAITTSWTYDSQHNKLTSVTGNSKTWTNTYDSSGNVLTVTNPDSVTVATLTYNSFSEPLTSTDALSHETDYQYDSLGNLTKVTDPLTHYTQYQYNSYGLLIQQTDANSHVTTYGYDTYGNMTSLEDPDLKTTSWVYNSLSQETSRTDPLSHTTSYSHDNLGRLTQITYPSGTNPTFSYDAGDLLTSFTDATGTTSRVYDKLYRLTSETVRTRTVSYTYDKVGNRATMTDPDSRAFTYTTDDGGRLISVALGGTTQVSYTYDADGNQTGRTNANGTTVASVFDNEDRLTSVTNKNSGGTTLSSFAYTYNNNGLRTGVTEADSSTVTWGYDSLNRLTSDVRTGTNAYSASYTLDPVGNWSSRTVGGTPTSYTYDNADRIQTAGSSITYSWNNDGTLASKTVSGTTTSFTWDYEQRLTGITGGLSYTWDAEGRRVSRTASGTTTTPVLDGGSVLLEKQSGTTVQSYVYGTGLVTRGSETMLYDGHGDLRTVTNASQTVTATGNYEAYGTSVGGTGSSSTPYQYGATSGYRNDGDAGLTYVGARWYDASIGRWISADSYLGQPAAPLARNRYVYCQAQPVNACDPTGHSIAGLGGDVIFLGLGILALVSVILGSGGLIVGAIGVSLIIVGISDLWSEYVEHTSELKMIALERAPLPDPYMEYHTFPTLYSGMHSP